MEEGDKPLEFVAFFCPYPVLIIHSFETWHNSHMVSLNLNQPSPGAPLFGNMFYSSLHDFFFVETQTSNI